jgi:TolA-binding protein
MKINIQDKNSINAEIDNNNEQKPENIPENVEKVQEQKEEIQKNENEINDKNDNIQENQNEIKKEDKKENEDKKLDVIEKKEEGKEEEEKEEDTTNEYIIRCEKCLLVPIINIDHTTYKIHYECENKHIKSDINIAQALKETKKISLKKCSSCGETSEEDNFICIQCLKVFCLDGGCKKKT